DVSKRVDLAFSRFVEGDYRGNRSGKPRIKNAARYRTIKSEMYQLLQPYLVLQIGVGSSPVCSVEEQ
ncbi:MAG: hypothetical protein ACIWVG_02290, partial [Gloeotrichia echinulata HAB0833]